MCPDMEKVSQTADGEEMTMEFDEDDEYAPTSDELRDEEEQEPLMMVTAARWDRFLSFVKEIQR
eukprot:2879982-Pleurochrysis_carterae.AAC.1